MTRVLIVDDIEENLYLLRVTLESQGYQVDSASDGYQALEKARRDPPDLIVSDLLMPNMDGYTLLRHWRSDERLHGIPFVVHTATYTHPQDQELAYELGAAAYLIKPLEPTSLLEKVAKLLEYQSPGESHSVYFSPAEAERYNEVLFRKLTSKSAELERANLALQRDLHERQLAQESAARSEGLYRVAARLGKLGGWTAELPDPRILWSDEVCTLHDMPLGSQPDPEQALEFFVPEARDRVTEAFRRALEKGEPLEFEAEVQTALGRRIWVRVSGETVVDAEGNPLRLQGAIQDITEQHQARARLAEQATLIDEASDAIVVRDLEGLVTYWSRGAERVYGWPAEEALGRGFADLVGLEPALSRTASDTVLATGQWNGEITGTTRSGQPVTLDSRWSLIRNEVGQPKAILSLESDITERRALEARFMRAQRLESVGTLAGGIAHDLSNLLAPIMLAADLLKTDESDPGRLELWGMLEKSAQRAKLMIGKVLTFARGVEGERTPVALSELLSELQEICCETFPKNLRIRSDIDPGLRPVRGDSTQLHQVLLNLCVNARDAMPDGGELTVTAKNVTLDDQYATLSEGIQAGHYISIEVSDSGCGIAPEHLDRIFEPFFTTKEVGRGTGLGLSTSLAIIRSHGGYLRVCSELGRGTLFQILLPAETVTSEQTGGHDDPYPAGDNELILLVEDEPEVAEVTRQSLESHGYKVIWAKDGAEGVAKYALFRSEVSVVFTDLAMPVMDGVALLGALRAIDPQVRVVAASGLGDARSGQYMLQQGVPLLTKPYTTGEMLAALGRARRHSGLSTVGDSETLAVEG